MVRANYIVFTVDIHTVTMVYVYRRHKNELTRVNYNLFHLKKKH